MYHLRPRSSTPCVLKLSLVDIELSRSQVTLSIFYFGKNIVVLACHVSLGDSFQFCWLGLKNNCYFGNNILVLVCLVSFSVDFFNLPNWTTNCKLVPLRCSCNLFIVVE